MSALPWDQLKKLKNRFTSDAADNIVVGKNVTIHPTAVIVGPVVIGDNCTIGVGAYIRPYSWIGNNCQIGHASEVKHSIFGNNVRLPHFNYVGDSVVGDNVHLGGGATLANYKSDGSTVQVEWEGVKIDSGLTKLGSIIGNNVEIGANCVLNPGTIVGDNVIIYAGAVLRGTIPDNSIVKIRQQQEIIERKS